MAEAEGRGSRGVSALAGPHWLPPVLLGGGPAAVGGPWLGRRRSVLVAWPGVVPMFPGRRASLYVLLSSTMLRGSPPSHRRGVCPADWPRILPMARIRLCCPVSIPGQG